MRRRAEHRDHVWAYDFVFDRTADRRKLRLLTIVDEYTRECLAVDVARRLLCKLCTAPGLLRPDRVGMWTVLGLLFGVFALAWIAWVAAPKPPPARYRRRDR